LLRVVAGADAAFERISREISATYILGVEPVPADRDGKPHRIDVRVRRPGASVSHREEVILPATPPPAPSRADFLREALVSPRTATALPLVLSHTTLRADTRDRVRLILSAEIGRGLSVSGEVNVAYVVSDSAGRVVGSASGKGPLPVAGQGAGAALAYVEVLAIPSGVYSVKLAAMDTAGRIGSILHHVDAQVEKGERALLSDLVLVDPARRSSDQLTPLADGRVIGDRLDTYLEVYPERQTRLTSVAFDISERPDSPALLSGASTPQEKDGRGRWTAGVTVDLRVLPPGVYTVSARALAGDRVIGRVSRPFRREAPARAAAGGEPRAEFAIAVSGGLLRTFNPHDALTPDALQFFLNRLQLADGGSESPAVSSAVAAVRNGKFDDAIATLSGAGTDRLSVPFLTGLALFGKSQLEPAAAQFRAALRISSEFLPAVFYLGACYAAGGRDREAAGAWQISLVTESDARIIYDVLADALLRLQDGGQALSILNEARERWPDDDAFIPRLAAAQALSQRRDQAVEILVPYIERHPADTAALVLAVRLLYDAHTSGTAATSPARDRELAAKFAALYRAASGPQAALVDRWVAFVKQSSVGR
jgi:tetratricopeptide (TPR) repeat protein